jgi:hypothetical protein
MPCQALQWRLHDNVDKDLYEEPALQGWSRAHKGNEQPIYLPWPMRNYIEPPSTKQQQILFVCMSISLLHHVNL